MAVPDAGRRTTLLAFLLLLVAVGAPVLVLVRPYALTLLVAAILAVISDPAFRRLRRRGWPPPVAGFVVTGGMLLLVLAPIGLFTWAALRQALALPGALAGSVLLDVDTQVARLREWGLARRLLGDPAAIEDQLRAAVAGLAGVVTNLVLAGLSQVPSILLHGALALLACYFFLVDGRGLVAWLAGKVPLPPQIVEVLRDSFRKSAGAVVLASMAAASAQAAVTMVAFVTLGVPAAFVAAGCAFVFAWVPLLGVAPVYLAGMVWLGVEQAWVRLVLLLVAGCGAGLVDNVVRPLVLRGQQQMHPMVSLVAIFGGIATFGIFGAFIGPVLAAVLIALLETWPAVARYAGVEVGETGRPPEIPL